MKNLIVSSMLLLAGLNTNLLKAQNSENSNYQKGQNNLSPDERVKKETEKATLKLGLSSDQKMKWEAASAERINANLPLKKKMQGSTTPEERKNLKTQMQSNNMAFDTNVLSFLNADQKAKYEAFKKEKKGKGHGHHLNKMN